MLRKFVAVGKNLASLSHWEPSSDAGLNWRRAVPKPALAIAFGLALKLLACVQESPQAATATPSASANSRIQERRRPEPQFQSVASPFPGRRKDNPMKEAVCL